MRKILYKKGEKINGLAFISEAEPHQSPSRSSRTAVFECYCGNYFKSIIRSVVSGNTKSCGCFGVESRSKRFTKHGRKGEKIYGVWAGIKTRCFNKNRADYAHYGGRGITIEEYLTDFSNFYNYVSCLHNFEMLEVEKLTIERIDNNKNYERGNLRWATRKEQAQNRRSRSS